MGWIQYPSKATIRDGLRDAEPGAALAARTLADQLLTHLDRISDPATVETVVYSSLVRSAHEADTEGRANRFDLLVLAKVHGELITDLATAMVVFVSREKEGVIVDGEALSKAISEAMTKLGGP